MGKFANQANWERFKPLSNAPEYYEEPEPPVVLNEDERDREFSEHGWNRRDATADELDRAQWAYSIPVVRVRLFDEAGR